MKPFLKQVADHYIEEGNLKDLCFVFPNRRSSKFFAKMLGESLASSAPASPTLAPSLVTISDFFAKAADESVTDRITLLLVLYDCYSRLYPKAETLDEFIYWGDVLLGDFNDVDKYRVDASQIFTNVADFKAIRDDWSHLSEGQRKAIESFISHFSDEERREGGKENVKETFRQIWNILLPLYDSFREVLRGQGRAYEGMVYRSFADRLGREACSDILAESSPHVRKFVFVGLNALNECEKAVLSAMRDAHLAEFCWDWSGDMIRHELNKSSFFMRDNVRRFPQAFTIDPDGVELPEFNVVSVPSSVGQVKQVSGILSGKNPDECAVVLPDETLLIPLLNSISPDIRDINVTMGYPMSSSEFHAFMHDIHMMQLNVRKKGESWCFFHKYVWNIFSSGIFRTLVGSDETLLRNIDEIRKARKFYIPQSDLLAAGLPEVIFRPAAGGATEGESAVRSLCAYLCDVAAYAGSKMESALETDFAKEYHTSVTRLSSKGLEIKLSTFVHLLESMLAGVAVPFNGEPLKGLQIMGPLEIRALDFKNLVILSANEGVFPRRSVSSSFIPPELRRGFGLPTYEFQDAVWAYYFYRMITRAEHVWMLYDSRTEGLKSGEESRYIKQLCYHFGVRINRYVASSSIKMPDAFAAEIAKTGDDIRKIRERSLSASSIQNYIDCPAKFYYHVVCGLRKEDEVSESMDNGMIGTVYHNAMRALLIGADEMMSVGEFDKLDHGKRTKGQGRVTRAYLKEWLSREKDVRRKVVSLICAELHSDEVVGRDIVMTNVIVKYVMKTIEREIELLDRAGVDSFEVIGVEMDMNWSSCGLRFYGVLDRVDRYLPGVCHLVDYKTGRDDPAVLQTTDADAEEVVDSIFDPHDTKHRERKAALQFHIYDRMLETTFGLVPGTVANSLYSTSGLFLAAPSASVFSERFRTLMDERLEALLKEITDPDVPFRRTDCAGACTYCDFRMICGR